MRTKFVVKASTKVQAASMNLEHVETKTNGETKLDKYIVGNYSVKVFTRDWGTSVEIRKLNKQEYLPDIYSVDDMEGGIVGFEVQTTSYGSLPVDELRQVIAGLEEAAKVAEILTEEFV